MNSVTFDWLSLTVILSTFAACAVVGWFAARLVNRFEDVNRMEAVEPIVEVQQIEVTVVDQGLRRWRRAARVSADKFQLHPERSSLSPKSHEQGN
jgi:hypothetical protein